MTTRYSLFTKMAVLILMLLIPVLVLIGYSHKVSVDVVETELRQTNHKQLSFLLHQMDTSVEQLQHLAVMLNRDPSIRDLPYLYYQDSMLDRIKTKNAVMEKLTLQSLSSNWKNEFVVYSPVSRQAVGSVSSLDYDEKYFQGELSQTWRLETIESEEKKERRMFKLFVADSLPREEDLSKTKLILEVMFDADNISALLSNYQEGGRGSPFLYHKGELPVHGKYQHAETTQELLAWLDGQNLPQEGTLTVKLNGNRYLVTYLKSRMLDWYLIDFLPLEDVLSPIYKSRNVFFAAISVLLAMSLIATVLLYRNIQIPIRHLVKGFKRIRHGHFSVRVSVGYSHEFVYLQQGFNEMAKEIQRLVESVYEEKIRSRDAKLKQLQAQVNPHFLYNCLAFITSMNALENREAVASMAHNLGDYYRFTTRSDKEKSSLRDELAIVTNYLRIQQMRMSRLRFEINIPEVMENLVIPRLSIQPIVENAVIHGIEMKPGEVMIRIEGSFTDRMFSLTIDDDGVGLSEAQIRELETRLRLPLETEVSYGLWNTYHRLQLMFGKTSTIEFARSPLGGLRVKLHWENSVQVEGGATEYDNDSDR